MVHAMTDRKRGESIKIITARRLREWVGASGLEPWKDELLCLAEEMDPGAAGKLKSDDWTPGGCLGDGDER
jgi:hypothetical protein